MANPIVTDLRAKSDAAWANLTRQLQGMEPYMDRSDAPGEWTTRQVLSHLLFEPGWNPVDFLKKFSTTDLPLGEIIPGQTNVTPERQKMTLRQFLDALGGQRREVFAYLEGLSEADLQGRKARNAGQLAKIRKAVGL